MIGRCPNRWGGQHQFEARYDREPVAHKTSEVDIRGRESRQLLLDMTTKTIYVRDICVRCGATVERGITTGTSS